MLEIEKAMPGEDRCEKMTVPVEGYFSLPKGPGLGVTLNEEVIRAHPPTSGHFSLFAEDWQLRRAR